MIQRRIISFSLLCLLLLINWHNSFFHSHHEAAKEEFVVVHQHDHHHSAHHHGQSEWALWDWAKQLLGDFEHPDLGEKHLEFFLNPGNQAGLDQASATVFLPFILVPQHFQFSALNAPQNNKIPIGAPSFSDPPFFDSFSNRGPPTFS